MAMWNDSVWLEREKAGNGGRSLIVWVVMPIEDRIPRDVFPTLQLETRLVFSGCCVP